MKRGHHKTTKRERRNDFAASCAMAHQMKRRPIKPDSEHAGRVFRMRSGREYTIGQRGNFIRL